MELYIEPISTFERKQRDSFGRFKPGHVPANKRTKGLTSANEDEINGEMQANYCLTTV